MFLTRSVFPPKIKHMYNHTISLIAAVVGYQTLKLNMGFLMQLGYTHTSGDVFLPRFSIITHYTILRTYLHLIVRFVRNHEVCVCDSSNVFRLKFEV